MATWLTYVVCSILERNSSKKGLINFRLYFSLNDHFHQRNYFLFINQEFFSVNRRMFIKRSGFFIQHSITINERKGRSYCCLNCPLLRSIKYINLISLDQMNVRSLVNANLFVRKQIPKNVRSRQKLRPVCETRYDCLRWNSRHMKQCQTKKKNKKKFIAHTLGFLVNC